jgi:hypothetical protein
MVRILFGERRREILGIQCTAQSVSELGLYLAYAVRSLFDCSILLNYSEAG